MSLVKVQGNASGTGTLTIAAPNTNSDRTLTLPDQTATLITDSSGVLNIGAGQVYKDASGNVGIGTTPGVKLDVKPADLGTTVNDSTYAYRATTSTVGNTDQFDVLWYRTASAAGWSNADLILQRNVDGSAGQSKIIFGGSNYTAFWTNSAERARIDSSGNLLVGTTSTGGEIGLLTVKQAVDADSGGLRLIAPNSSNAWAIRTGSDSSLYFGYNGTSKGVINQSSGNYSALSDVRLKENVQESVKGLSEILALRSVSYTFIDDEAKTEQLGFIAQEVEPVIPQVVSTPTSSNQYYGLNYAGVVPVLVKAIQELKAIVDAQGAEIAALKGQA